MSEKENLDELLSKENIELDKDNPNDIKRKVQVVEEELGNLWNLQWSYAKHLLKFGFASWILGISAFVASLLIYKGPSLITETPAISISLLIGAGAAPALITAFLVDRHQKKINRLERIRKGLLSQYETTLLKKIEEGVVE